MNEELPIAGRPSLHQNERTKRRSAPSLPPPPSPDPIPRMDLPLAKAIPAKTIHDAWLPTRKKLVAQEIEEDLRIRIHRACRALEQAEAMEGRDGSAGSLDAALVFRWIGLNALYGAWDVEQGMPVKDRVAVSNLTSEICRVDVEGRMAKCLALVADPARELLMNSFLANRFWKDPEWDQVRPNRGNAAAYRNELLEKRTSAALHRLLMAIYFLRCQIVHGGSTIGGKLNRETVEPAARILELLSSQILATVVEHGLEMKWGPVCYPPVRNPDGSPS